jgi:hypothetical protein
LFPHYAEPVARAASSANVELLSKNRPDLDNKSTFDGIANL